MISNRLKNTLFTLSILTFSFINSNAQSLNGQVVDAATGEPMIGATVVLKEQQKKQIVQLDGKFSFKNISTGAYTLEISYSNYKTETRNIIIDV